MNHISQYRGTEQLLRSIRMLSRELKVLIMRYWTNSFVVTFNCFFLVVFFARKFVLVLSILSSARAMQIFLHESIFVF